MDDTTITPKVIDAAVWALLGYSKPPHPSNPNFPDVDWNIQRTWRLSEVKKQVALALHAASDIFATEQAAENERLRAENSGLAQMLAGQRIDLAQARAD